MYLTDSKRGMKDPAAVGSLEAPGAQVSKIICSLELDRNISYPD
jgi:hypothetical protein